MKTLLVSLGLMILMNSCVFEEPFETKANIPVDPGLLGSWEHIPADPQRAPERMLVIQHSENEYVVQYPVGEKAMFFRVFAVDLGGGKFMQAQLTGTAEGPVKPDERKYHLLKVSVEGDAMGMQTIRPELLGKDVRTTAQLKKALAEHVNDAKLFDEAMKFQRKN